SDDFIIRRICKHILDRKGRCRVCGLEDAATNEDQRKMKPDGWNGRNGHSQSRTIEVGSLLEQRKLLLLLDLDSTLLHATQKIQVDDFYKTLPKEEKERIFQFTLDESGGQPTLLKFRPHLENFLAAVSSNFVLSIFTAGTKEYARKVVQLMDPQCALFGGRIFCADNMITVGGTWVKSVSHVVPGLESVVVCLDDMWRAWNFDQRVVQVSPYTYFPTDTHPPKTNSEGLTIAADLLLHIHDTYFKQTDSLKDKSSVTLQMVDVVDIMKPLRQSVFAGLTFCFTLIYGGHEGSFPNHHLVKASERFGGTVVNELTNNVTHLVTKGDLISEKLRRARGMSSVQIVDVAWLLQSFYTFQRADENDHPPHVDFTALDEKLRKTQEKTAGASDGSAPNTTGSTPSASPTPTPSPLHEHQHQTQSNPSAAPPSLQQQTSNPSPSSPPAQQQQSPTAQNDQQQQGQGSGFGGGGSRGASGASGALSGTGTGGLDGF
ncbi:hypothetical protein HDV00_005155, partial [Rhizophlyctis rosea]